MHLNEEHLLAPWLPDDSVTLLRNVFSLIKPYLLGIPKFKRSEDAFQVKISAMIVDTKVRLGNAQISIALFVFLQSQIEKQFEMDLQTFLRVQPRLARLASCVRDV